jgi:excisionase family DNA binding protein
MAGARIAPTPGVRNSGLRLVVELDADALPDDLVELVALRAAAIVVEQLAGAPSSPYLTVAEAADYLRCSRQRVYDLLTSRRLSRLKDGTRTLLRRDELDAWLEEEAAGDALLDLDQARA